MFSGSITLSTLAIVGGALAQTSTVTLYIPGADPQSLVGAVVGTVCASPPSGLSVRAVLTSMSIGFFPHDLRSTMRQYR